MHVQQRHMRYHRLVMHQEPELQRYNLNWQIAYTVDIILLSLSSRGMCYHVRKARVQ